MGYQHIDAEALATQSEIRLSCVEGILARTHSITQDVAEKLSWFFGTTSEFWENLQHRFEERAGTSQAQTGCEECEGG